MAFFRSRCCMASLFAFLALIFHCVGPAWCDEFIIGMKNWEFHPQVLTIRAGDTVVWVNDDDSHHKIIFEDASIKGSDNIKPDRRYSLTFERVGEYNYYCKYHGDYGMKGTIIVKGGGN